MTYPIRPAVRRANIRADHISSLVCNVGLRLEVLVPLTLGNPKPGLSDKMLWAVDVYFPDGTLKGHYAVYKHERSAVRAVWRLYREKVGE